MTFTTILVANRGEIARRVIASARRAGLSTVAVYSDADAGEPFTQEADLAVRLPGDAASQTYLRPELLIDAARRAGADAIHPGYGFLSEAPEFARAVIAAGLTWIGPPPEAMAQMGSKIESKKLMDAAGVPVLTQLNPDDLTEADLPVLIKASAGGGGRGMRVVRDIASLPSEWEAATREAGSAFSDSTVFCERYFDRGHHVEVQVMADQHGTVWAVGERECSIQRRHQKVIEEAPSPLVERTPGMRERLFEAARLAATAINYEGAGTVEFLATDDGEFFFLEMNTRIQVEHPVTENTTGLDLIATQFAVAAGERLGPQPPAAHGSSIEARLYAENPAADWQPGSGTLAVFEFPSQTSAFEPVSGGVRVDSGVRVGSVVGVHYDPMLAKVIATAPTRAAAIALLTRALVTSRVHGVRTNTDLLVNVLRHPAFAAGDTDTAFLTDHDLSTLAAPLVSGAALRHAAIAAMVARARRARDARVAAGLPNVASVWRNMPVAPLTAEFDEVTIAYQNHRDQLVFPDDETVTLAQASEETVTLVIDGITARFVVAHGPDSVLVSGPRGPITLHPTRRFTDPGEHTDPGSLLAPMPGTVIRIGAAPGDVVNKGTPILWLEAMKMEHAVLAPSSGAVETISVQVGQQVVDAQVLAVMATATDD